MTGADRDYRLTVASRWFSARAIRLHFALAILVPACAALCVWQVNRALSGNDLSWAYVFEWPFFAGYGIYMWWRLVHEQLGAPLPPRPRPLRTASGHPRPRSRRPPTKPTRSWPPTTGTWPSCTRAAGRSAGSGPIRPAVAVMQLSCEPLGTYSLPRVGDIRGTGDPDLPHGWAS